MKVKGLDSVLKNLNKEIEGIRGNTRKGLSKAGLFIKGEAVERAPVEFGILRNSAFSQLSPIARKSTASVKIGFTAEYAAYVHEMPMVNSGKPRQGTGKKGTYWEGGENKFLEKAVKLNIKEILGIIQKEAGKDLVGNRAR